MKFLLHPVRLIDTTEYLPQFDNGDGISLLLKGEICIRMQIPLQNFDISSSHLPSSSCQHSLWTTPRTNLVVYGNQFVTLHKHAIIHTTTLCLLGYMIRFSYFLDVIRISGKKRRFYCQVLKNHLLCTYFSLNFQKNKTVKLFSFALRFAVWDNINFNLCYPSHFFTKSQFRIFVIRYWYFNSYFLEHMYFIIFFVGFWCHCGRRQWIHYYLELWL